MNCIPTIMHWHNFIIDLTWISHIYWKSIIMDTCFYLLQYIAVLLISILFLLLQAADGAIVESRADFGQVFLCHSTINILNQGCSKVGVKIKMRKMCSLGKLACLPQRLKSTCGVKINFRLWGNHATTRTHIIYFTIFPFCL